MLNACVRDHLSFFGTYLAMHACFEIPQVVCDVSVAPFIPLS